MSEAEALREKIAQVLAYQRRIDIGDDERFDDDGTREGYWRALPEMARELLLLRADSILSLLPPAPVPAGAGDRLLNLTKALLDDANQEVSVLQTLLTKASEEVCSNQCRSYFPARHVRSDADHSELCHAIRAALDAPAERPAPPSGGMTEGARADDAFLLWCAWADRLSPEQARAAWEEELSLIDKGEWQRRAREFLALRNASPPAPASGTTEDGWRTMESAPKDGTLFLGCNPDHPSFGSWPMCRRVEHTILSNGDLHTRDLGGWLIVGGIEPDLHEGGAVREVKTAIAQDEHNQSVRYGWRPLPAPPSLKKAREDGE